MTELTPRQLRAIAAIAEADSISAAAERCKTNRATLHRWLRLPEFREALDEMQRDQRDRAVRRLSAALDRSAQTVIDLADHATDEAIKLRAAMAVPQMLRELLDIEAAQDRPIVIDAQIPTRPVTVFDHSAAIASIAGTAESQSAPHAREA